MTALVDFEPGDAMRRHGAVAGIGLLLDAGGPREEGGIAQGIHHTVHQPRQGVDDLPAQRLEPGFDSLLLLVGEVRGIADLQIGQRETAERWPRLKWTCFERRSVIAFAEAQ